MDKKNRFEEEAFFDSEQDELDELTNAIFGADSIYAQHEDDGSISNPQWTPEEDIIEATYQEIYSCVDDDHGLTYAVIYAYLFLLSQNEQPKIVDSDWRPAFENLIDLNNIIRFYKTRRDSPEFVRARIRNVLDTLGWDETSPIQQQHVYDGFLQINLCSRVFLGRLTDKDLFQIYIGQCKNNYEVLEHKTKNLDRESICKGLEARIFTGVRELRFAGPSFIEPEENIEDSEVLWVSSAIQSSTRKGEAESFIRKLSHNRYKPRLKVDEAVFTDLEEGFPNFIEVITYYKAQFRLNLLTGRDYIPPVLLLGAPGIGKTAFAKALATALQTGYTFIDMASASANWILSGLSTSWNGAKPGKLVTAMLDSPTASPVVLLDEIEKSGPAAHGQDSRTPLYQLLEENTARAFTDEFVDYPVDLSRVIYIACANSTEGLTEPLLSRFKIMEIPDPSDEEHDMIVDSIYQAEVAGSTAFPARLPHDIMHLLRGTSLRESKVMISDAIATALLEVTLNQMKDRTKLSLELQPQHFKFKTVQKKKMGF